MDTFLPLLGVIIATGLSAGLKWLGKQSTNPWHKWVIPLVPGVLTIFRLAAALFHINIPEVALDAGIASSGAMALHQLYQGVKETKANGVVKP